MRSPTSSTRSTRTRATACCCETYALTGDLPPRAARCATRSSSPGTTGARSRGSTTPRPSSRPHAHGRGPAPAHRARLAPRARASTPRSAPPSTRSASSARQRAQGAGADPARRRCSMAEIAREVGLPQPRPSATSRRATSRFAVHRDVREHRRPTLGSTRCGPARRHRWPRSTIIRRTGTARRRTHTLIGAAAVVAALLSRAPSSPPGAPSRAPSTRRARCPGSPCARPRRRPAPRRRPLLPPTRSSATAAACPGARARRPTTWRATAW